VEFDESIFWLHENARARFRSKIILLPSSLIPSDGVVNTELPMTNFLNRTNEAFVEEITGQHAGQDRDDVQHASHVE
jgi:hypothetical protein